MAKSRASEGRKKKKLLDRASLHLTENIFQVAAPA